MSHTLIPEHQVMAKQQKRGPLYHHSTLIGRDSFNPNEPDVDLSRPLSLSL